MSFKSQEQPLCRCCGKRVPKFTERVWVDDKETDYGRRNGHAVGPLYSIAECQQRTNLRVVSVQYDRNADRGVKGRKVWSFTTWDGESYVDAFFCGGTCVDRFAYVMARAGDCTNAYNDAIAKRRERRIAEAS